MSTDWWNCMRATLLMIAYWSGPHHRDSIITRCLDAWIAVRWIALFTHVRGNYSFWDALSFCFLSVHHWTVRLWSIQYNSAVLFDSSLSPGLLNKLHKAFRMMENHSESVLFGHRYMSYWSLGVSFDFCCFLCSWPPHLMVFPLSFSYWLDENE